MNKSELRSIFLEKRQTIDEATALNAGRNLVNRCLKVIPPEASVGGYCATRGEINVMPTLMALAVKGHAIALPATLERKLVFRAWQPGSALFRGKFNIQEPAPDAPEMVPDVILVPLVAFDAKGNRLGYGAGYYDRALDELRKRNNNLLTVGIAYAIQQAEQVPIEPHDVRLHYIVTEAGVIKA